MVVMKFGGASLSDLKNFLNVVSFIQDHAQEQKGITVVVSAMKDVTQRLIDASTEAEHRNFSVSDEHLDWIYNQHKEVLEGIKEGEDKEAAESILREALEELRSLCHAVGALQECTPRAKDLILSFGERLSSCFLSALLRQAGVDAVQIPGEGLIVTDEQFGSAYPLEESTNNNVQKVLKPLFKKETIPVVAGFTGATQSGQTTTLGRGGTDFTASILGASLGAQAVWFMKEVDGIMSADPQTVHTARTIEVMSYQEVAELSFFGAKVLHPVAIHPLKQKKISAYIKNVYKHTFQGTLVEHSPDNHKQGPKAVTAISDVSMISVEGDGMIGIPGVAGRAFMSIAKHGVNILMISQTCSEQNICLAVKKEDQAGTLRALSQEFELEILQGRIDRVMARDDVAIISLVGAGMSGVPGIAGKLFWLVGENQINVLMIAQGSSEVNISFLLESKDVKQGMRCIHDGFELGALND